jgi:hypothetical protein
MKMEKIVFFINYYEEDEMDRPCTTHGMGEK